MKIILNINLESIPSNHTLLSNEFIYFGTQIPLRVRN